MRFTFASSSQSMATPFPPEFESRMKIQLGESWSGFADAHEQPAPVSIRMNPRKTTPDTTLPVVPWTKHGRYLPLRPVFTLDPTFHAGAYYVQEASSMFLEEVFKQAVPNDRSIRVLDLCAAPGGKSTHILSLINSDSLLVSNEVIRSRVSVLTENLQKWGHQNVIVTNNDAADFQRLPDAFDVIVLDAPCSGEGLFRKDPDAMREWSTANVELCAARQKRIIADVWPTLRAGGILIYSTCTYNQQEDEENLLWLKREHDIESLALEIDNTWNIEKVTREGITGYKFYPDKIRGEGFFISVIRKPGLFEGEPVHNARKNSVSAFASPTPRVEEQLRSWVQNPDHKKFILRESTLQFFPLQHFAFLEQVSRNLRIHMAGTFIGNLKYDKIVPEHALALSTEINASHFFKVELSEHEALSYLRRESLRVDVEYKGFALATFKKLHLGWMNVITGRINNLYPQEWRIRMGN
jgi:16S rRNA C967 or C1407 C5-methylase (RsmB/RsmF family)/NOL1/NOP2/fmu family ribosome biogenesis protein